MSDFLKNIGKITGNEFAGIAEDGIEAGDIKGWINTGVYSLNALLSGSIYGGIPNNKITVFAGESSVGKTFFLLSIVKEFLDANPKAVVVYFESESAITKDMLTSRGIDVRRFVVVPVSTVEEFRTQALRVLDGYNKDIPLMACLDSLGMLSTNKEVNDATEGKDTRDMTRAQLVKGAFRLLTLKLGRAGVPLLVTNHTYDEMGMFPKKHMGGGSGLRYAGTNIIFLSKKKDKEGTEVTGNIIHCKNEKSRTTIENKMVDVLLSYSAGLNKYYGLEDIAIKHGIFKNISTKIELPDGTKVFSKALKNNPEKYYTEDVLKAIDEACKKEFLYGAGEEPPADEDEE